MNNYIFCFLTVGNNLQRMRARSTLSGGQLLESNRCVYACSESVIAIQPAVPEFALLGHNGSKY